MIFFGTCITRLKWKWSWVICVNHGLFFDVLISFCRLYLLHENSVLYVTKTDHCAKVFTDILQLLLLLMYYPTKYEQQTHGSITLLNADSTKTVGCLCYLRLTVRSTQVLCLFTNSPAPCCAAPALLLPLCPSLPKARSASKAACIAAALHSHETSWKWATIPPFSESRTPPLQVLGGKEGYNQAWAVREGVIPTPLIGRV